MEQLLEYAEEGIRLTPKGNLPTKIVRELVECCPTAQEKRFLGIYKRFYEEEHFAAMLTRDLCESGRLLQRKGKKLVAGEILAYFRTLTEAERFVYPIRCSRQCARCVDAQCAGVSERSAGAPGRGGA